MRFILHFLGLEILDVEISTGTELDEPEPPARGEVTSFPVGFTPSPGDQRWERCADYGEDDEE